MTTIIQGVDGSYTALTAEKAACLQRNGVEVWAQCLWTATEVPPPARDNLEIAVQEGLIPIGYISVNGGHAGTWHVEHGRQVVTDRIWNKLVHVPIDVELEGIPHTVVRQAVDAASRMGKQRSIYTSFNAWVNYMGNPRTFTDCWLWNALWDKYPDIDFAALPFGDWTMDHLIGEQWHGGMSLCELNVDRDSFIKEKLIQDPNDFNWSEVQRSLAHDVTGPVPSVALRRVKERLDALFGG